MILGFGTGDDTKRCKCVKPPIEESGTPAQLMTNPAVTNPLELLSFHYDPDSSNLEEFRCPAARPY